MKDKEYEVTYFSFSFFAGLLLGIAEFDYPEYFRKDFVIYILFMRFGYTRQMMDEDELEEFNNES